MSKFIVTSEVHTENTENQSSKQTTTFKFKCPSLGSPTTLKYDKDGDLILNRNREEKLVIEHKTSTELKFVGLQVWRGALLLADYILANSKVFRNKKVLELGSGVGLTSIIASMFAKEVICTDINLNGILDLIARNVKNNSKHVRGAIKVMELDFLNRNWPVELSGKISQTSIILAADVIYDTEVTEGFVKTLAKLLKNGSRVALVALEKRYVFTIADLDSVAPMYEEFLQCIEKENLKWTIEMLKIDFPQYFYYDRTSQMILMKIRQKN